MTTPAVPQNTLPEPEFTILHREAHRLLCLNRATPDMRWIGQAISVALAAGELASAATVFPCVMTRASAGGARLLAITGLEHGHNLFVDAQGHWSGVYLPAVLRTWPFRLLAQPEEQGVHLIAVHRPALTVGDGDALFDESGQEMPWLQAILRELTALDAATASTAAAVAALEEAGLLQERTLQVMLPNFRQLELTGFLSVDEAKLNALEPAKAGELHACGALALAYLQLLSMRQIRPLMDRAAGQQLAQMA
jgi:hypothetical protein